MLYRATAPVWNLDRTEMVRQSRASFVPFRNLGRLTRLQKSTCLLGGSHHISAIRQSPFIVTGLAKRVGLQHKGEDNVLMAKVNDLDEIRQQRVKVEAMLADVIKREREAEEALKDAGRPALLAALEKVKIGPMQRTDAKAIASAIAKHGGDQVARLLEQLSSK